MSTDPEAAWRDIVKKFKGATLRAGEIRFLVNHVAFRDSIGLRETIALLDQHNVPDDDGVVIQERPH